MGEGRTSRYRNLIELVYQLLRRDSLLTRLQGIGNRFSKIGRSKLVLDSFAF